MAFLSELGDCTRYITLHYCKAELSILEMLKISRFETCMASTLSDLVIDTSLKQAQRPKA